MNSPAFPSSPVCDQTNLRSSFSSSPASRHRTRTRSIGSVAYGKLKSVAKLANATLGKINSKKQKAPPVPKLPPVLPLPVNITAKPFISFCPMVQPDNAYDAPLPCLLNLSAQEELLERSVSDASIDPRACLEGPHQIRPEFHAPRIAHAHQPSSLWSSPTSSSGCSAQKLQTRGTISPSSSSHSDGLSPHRRFAGMDRPFVFPAPRVYPYCNGSASASSSSFSSYYSSSSPRAKVFQAPPLRKSSRPAP